MIDQKTHQIDWILNLMQETYKPQDLRLKKDSNL